MYFEARLTRKACVDSSRHRFPCDSDRSGHIFKQFAQEDVGTNSLILHVTSVPASCSLMVAPGILPRGPGSLASFSALTLSPLSVLLAQTCCGTQKQGPLYSYSIILVRPTSQEHASPISNCFLSEFGEGVFVMLTDLFFPSLRACGQSVHDRAVATGQSLHRADE